MKAYLLRTPQDEEGRYYRTVAAFFHHVDADSVKGPHDIVEEIPLYKSAAEFHEDELNKARLSGLKKLSLIERKALGLEDC